MPDILKATGEDFDQMVLKFEDLTYERMVLLWCVSSIPDSILAEKCGVPKGKITYLRAHKYDIELYNMREHMWKVFGRDEWGTPASC